MRDRRTSVRHRADVLVDFTLSESKITGVIHDVSLNGMFVRTNGLPEPGQKLITTLRFPDGRQLMTQGRVVRTFHPSPRLRGVLPTGFGMNISNGEGLQRVVSWVQNEKEPPEDRC